MRRRAYETLLAVDEQIERTLLHLEELGARERTLVLLTSDNGVGWGEHGLFFQRKGCPYQECQRVPMVVASSRWKGSGGVVSQRPVLNVDVAPTVAELAGIPVPAGLDGVSFASALPGAAGSTPSRKDYLMEYEQPRPGLPTSYVGVSDLEGGLKWIEYRTGERELYDLTRDPHELENRAGDPRYADEQDRLARRLRELSGGDQ